MPTITETNRQVEAFPQLLRGWYFGKGVPFSQETIANAQRILAKAEQLNFSEASAFPGADGEIQIVIYSDEEDYEFTIEADGTIALACERNEEEITYQEALSIEDALDSFEQASVQSWLFSGSSIAATMTASGDVSGVWLSGIPATAPVYQWSRVTVPETLAGQFVITSHAFTEILAASQLSIGKYLTTFGPQDALPSKKTANLEINAITTSRTGQLRMLGSGLKRCA